MVNRKQYEESRQRYNDSMKSYGGVEGIKSGLNNNNIKAEYDTWSWYYSELSNVRTECRKLGLLVRINNSESPGYVKAYHAHIYSYLQMILTVLPDELSDDIREQYHKESKKIKDYFWNRNATGMDYKVPQNIIEQLDFLHDLAAEIAQKVGLGFKVTIDRNTKEALQKRIIGE